MPHTFGNKIVLDSLVVGEVAVVHQGEVSALVMDHEGLDVERRLVRA